MAFARRALSIVAVCVLHNNVYLVEVIPFTIFSIVYPLRGTHSL